MSLLTVVASLLQGDPIPDRAGSSFQVLGASRSDTGLCRANNEDSVAWVDYGPARGALAVVADGMGGAQGGEVASDLAVRVIRERFENSRTSPGQALCDAFATANSEIFRLAQEDGRLAGMGTTCVAAAVLGDSLWAAWTGDARLYLYRNEALYQLSQDDTVVGELVRTGKLSTEAARGHEDRHVLTRSLGTRQTVEVGTLSQPVALLAQDRLLLCSDGVHDMLDDAEIGSILNRPTPAQSLESLIQECNRRGGYDNASAVVVALSAGPVSGASL
jgi:protein phosphatase